MAAAAEAALRFAVADRVRCKVSASRWSRGQVIQLQYREDHWPADKVAPYQIQLDDGRQIFCPEDLDCLIQAVGSDDDDVDGSPAEILVCQAGACRRMGSEAVLHEIEELASSVGAAVVQSSGCLGNCSQAPNAVVVTESDEKLFARIRDLSCSAQVVQHACGRAPDLEDDELVAKLQRARRVRVRMQAKEECKWNLALSGFAEEVEQASAGSAEGQEELMQEQAELLAAAGFAHEALQLLSAAAPTARTSLRDIPKLRLLLQRAEMLAQLGLADQLAALVGHVSSMAPGTGDERRIQGQVLGMLRQSQAGCAAVPQPADRPPLRIQHYAEWQLESIRPVSKHSAVRASSHRTQQPARREAGAVAAEGAACRCADTP